MTRVKLGIGLVVVGALALVLAHVALQIAANTSSGPLGEWAAGTCVDCHR
jgi:hypothetical protein